MKDIIKSHLVTIFLNSNNYDLNGMMFTEDDGVKHHAEALKNIEKK